MQQLYYILIVHQVSKLSSEKSVHAKIYRIFEGKNGQVPGLISGVRPVNSSDIYKRHTLKLGQ